MTTKAEFSFQFQMARLRFGWQRHGVLAAVGLALMAGAAGLHFFGVLEARSDTDALNAQATRLRLLTIKRPDPQEATSKRLAAFYSALPAAAGSLDAVDLIHQSASQHGVKLATGEYRLLRDGVSPVQRYQLTLPAQGSYPNLRLWLADIMNSLSAVALDEISIRRDDVTNSTVDARVRLTLYLRVP